MRPINTIDFTNPIRPRIRKTLVWRKAFGQSEWCFDLCLEPGGSFGACRASTQCILVRPRAGAGTAARRPYHCRRKLSQQQRSAEVDSCPFAEDGRASFVCHVRATASIWNSTVQLSALPISCEGGWAMTLGSQRIQWMEFMPADNAAPRGSSIGIECHRCCRGNLRDVPKHPYRDYTVVFQRVCSCHVFPFATHSRLTASCCRHMLVFDAARPNRASAAGAWIGPNNPEHSNPQQSLSTVNRRSQEKSSCSKSSILEIGGC